MSFELVNIIFDVPLLNSEKSVLLALARHVNQENFPGGDLLAWPSRELIAHEAGCKNLATVSRSVAALQAKGLITVSEKYERTPRGGHRPTSNEHRINLRGVLELIVKETPYPKHREAYRTMLDNLPRPNDPALHDARGVGDSCKGGPPHDARGEGGMVQGGALHDAPLTKKENLEENKEEDQPKNPPPPSPTPPLAKAPATAKVSKTLKGDAAANVTRRKAANPATIILQTVKGRDLSDRQTYAELATALKRSDVLDAFDAGLSVSAEVLKSKTAALRYLDRVETLSTAPAPTVGEETP